MSKQRIFVFIILLLFVALFLSACNNIEVSIYFDSNGGSKVAPVTTTGNTTISIPQNPTKEGFVFVGWFWDDETFNNPFTSSSLKEAPVQSDTTIYAKWDPIEATPTIITFNSNGGSDIAPITIEQGATIIIPNSPTKAGYSFEGWYLDDATHASHYSCWNKAVLGYRQSAATE